MVDATILFHDLLRDNWDPTKVVDRNGNQVLADAPAMHTGWYNRDGDIPCITFTNKDESPITQGNTGYYGTDTTGLGMNLMGGALLINFVAGTTPRDPGDDLYSIGPNGERRNPKKVRSAMAEHGRQLIIDNQRTLGLRSVNPGSTTDIVDADEGPAVYRTEVRPSYVYEETPSPTA